MMEYLQSLFEENFNVDDREPVLEFHIPSIDGAFSVYAPKVGPWIQLLISEFLQSIIQVAVACLIYEAIVKRRGYLSSYILGWGFIIPLSVYLPFYLLKALDMRNKVLCLGSSTAMSVIFFRCIEAMYGTSPPFVELSLSNYCSYYQSMVPFVWNSKTKKIEKITAGKLLRSLTERLIMFVGLSIYQIHYDYMPFEDTVSFTNFSITPDLLSPGHLCNSYLMTVLFYLALSNLFELSAFGTNAKGNVAEKLFDSPLTKSRTPTEFWTKRWNRMVHKLLKGGIFEPSKLCFQSKAAAMFITFVTSGLYHEYVWVTVFYDEDRPCTEGEKCYEFQFGRVTAFFAYTGMIMLLERPMKKLSVIKWMSSNLPTLVIAQLLVCLHTLVKWYGGDWIEGGLFDDFSIMLFVIRKR
eukprot:CAMPEP_0116136602 /NCGR_PEP_ID=MMETSP0329-20121206/11812_1 /TAXON_ID=697910 /ORGANISM="Pseudo-nitzschia arenysensis, Strain B593" /LENGTH=408 /DNA_ID=CAMNT_0003631481 /DNA_START=61 /DNA_END=1287 /DNA_ORIENTATION=+